jgi:hypothetical protein
MRVASSSKPGGAMLVRSGFRIIVVAAMLLPVVGCAALRLNGCRKVDSCGEKNAYVCETDLVCVDRQGQVIHSEPISGRRSSCRVCGNT